jgi:two-component system phosphate regulon sensor histidine kinase PhoR
LLASFLVLAYVSGRFARRLRRLQRVARGIGQGEAAARAAEAPDDDLGQLGRALNEMHAELDARLEALRRERDDRELILAHMSDGVALIDGTDHVVHVNHRFAELLDAPLRPGPGTPFTAFTRVPELAELAAAARSTGRTVERELRPWTTRTRSARATATPLGSATPSPVLLVLQDLSESEALQRMRQDFVANVSHELRTPLTSLRGYAETLLEGGLDDAEHRESFVRVMRDQAVRLQALVEDLLSLSEMERPDATLRREPLDLHALAAEQVAQVREAATRAGLGVALEGASPVRVFADRVRLTQALANLVDNAVKYTERGSVTVVVGEAGGRAWCEVRDTGPGIPPEDLPRVFERFYRVDKARSRERGGTGLGLAIVKHAVALHEGTVTVGSRVGEGTTFRFEIPAAPAR